MIKSGKDGRGKGEWREEEVRENREMQGRKWKREGMRQGRRRGERREKKTKERSRWEDGGEGKGEGKEGVRAEKERMKGIGNSKNRKESGREKEERREWREKLKGKCGKGGGKRKGNK